MEIINLESWRSLEEQPECSKFIKRIKNPITYTEFFKDYLETNSPCLFESSFINDWPVTTDWVTDDGLPNLDFLQKNFGSAEVPVADCDTKQYDSQIKQQYLLDDYINYIKESTHQNDQQRTSTSRKCLYLKDWHFIKDFPKYPAYTTLRYFSSDWLNEYWHQKVDIKDDYQFVYIGPKSSWTPLHSDVFRSYSWSANICGRKRWVFFPPGNENDLRDTFNGLIYDIESPDLKDINKYPRGSNAKGIQVIQEAGETIFVPSGWHHQVWNLEDTISINHNWINGTNLKYIWEFLQLSLDQVENAIRDCQDMDDWTGQCQLMLRATHGMNYLEYFNFLSAIAVRRINCLKNGDPLTSFNYWKLDKSHVVYDASVLARHIELFIDDPRVANIKEIQEREHHPNKLLDDLQNILSESR